MGQVGEMPCKQYKIIKNSKSNAWWLPKALELCWSNKGGQGCSYIKIRNLYQCMTQEQNPFKAISQVAKFWD